MTRERIPDKRLLVLEVNSTGHPFRKTSLIAQVFYHLPHGLRRNHHFDKFCNLPLLIWITISQLLTQC